MRTLLLVLAALVLGLAGVLALAAHRWRSQSSDLVARLRRGGEAGPDRFSSAEIAGLPTPVGRYFRTVLQEGQPLIRHARFRQEGTFLLKPGAWRPFTAEQDVSVDPPGFVWDARIRMAPGVAVAVRDSFVDGAGAMRASVAGLVPMASVAGTPEIAAGALHRYLAEAAWTPTALLPSQGVVWTPVDDSTARATLTVGATTVWLDVHFGPDGLIERVYTPGRARDLGDGRSAPTPWQGRFSDYAERDGVRIPLSGEVEWLLPEGPQPYWRGRIADVSYER